MTAVDPNSSPISKSVKPDAILYLDRNENLYGPAPQCFDVLRSMTLHDLSVYSRDFTRGVKSSLSERLASNLRVPEAQLLLGEGSEDLLKQAVHCYLGPGDTILCPAQSWWYYQALASEVGGETVTYSLKQGGDSYYFDVDEMIALYEKVSPRIVLIASPNNPTGNTFPDDHLRKLVDAFRESIVILDEAYWGFSNSADDRISAFAAEYRNLIVLRTFSKYYALAGARIGFAVVGKSLGRLTKFAARYLGYNRISEALALAALDSTEYYNSVRKKMLRDREDYYGYFDGLSEYKAFRSDANFVLVRIPTVDTEPLRNFLLHRNIRIKFFSEPEFQNCVRITIGTHDQNRVLLQAFSEFSSTIQEDRNS
jgi:histidinol-phosphate aminotransferase